MNMNKKALVLCSGGPDGLVAAALLREQEYETKLLHFNYGQKAHLRESNAVAELSVRMKMELQLVDISSAFNAISSMLLTSAYRKMPEALQNLKPEDLQNQMAEVPMRNLIMLSIAAGIAQSTGIGYLATGNIAGGRYWDNQMEFTTAMDNLLKLASRDSIYIRVLNPVNHLSKDQVFREGMRLNVPLFRTWSCYLGGQKQCGVCASCIGRRKAFKLADVIDPTLYIADMPFSLP